MYSALTLFLFFDHLWPFCFPGRLASPILLNDSLKFSLNLLTDSHIIYVADDLVINQLFLSVLSNVKIKQLMQGYL